MARKVTGRSRSRLSDPVRRRAGRVEKIKKAALDKHLPLIEEAGKKGVQILGLQEIFNGPYFCPSQDAKWYDAAEPVPGPTTERMQGIAKKYQMAMVVPVYEREQAGVYYNTAAVIDADGTYLGKYRKNAHPAHERLLGEVLLQARQPRLPRLPDALRQGRRLHLLRPPLPRGRARARPQRRRDRLQPVGHGRRASRSTSGSSSSPRTRWPTATSSPRATASAPRPRGTSASSTGTSYFVDPRGNFLATGSEDKDELVVATCDLDMIEEVRRTWQFFRDRRPETYGTLVAL